MGRSVVLMSGYPASGKSTLGSQLADRLGFALVSKDAILMTLHAAFEFGPGDAAESLRTGAAAWAVFWRQAANCPSAVLDTNIQSANRQQIATLHSLDAQIVEVRCECPAELAMARYAERAKVGHPAQRFTRLSPERISMYAEPIGVGALLQVDTSGEVDLEHVVSEVTRLLTVR